MPDGKFTVNNKKSGTCIICPNKAKTCSYEILETNYKLMTLTDSYFIDGDHI